MAARSWASRTSFLKRRVPPVVAECMGEVHVGAEPLENIGHPVTAIRGFEDHLGPGPGGGQVLGEFERAG